MSDSAKEYWRGKGFVIVGNCTACRPRDLPKAREAYLQNVRLGIEEPSGPQPLPPALQARANRVFGNDWSLTPKQRALNARVAKAAAAIDEMQKYLRNERIRKLKQFQPPRQSKPSPPAPVDRLDLEIRDRVEAAPKEHRSALDALYAMFVMHNEAYFGGNLKLPYIAIAKLKNSQANCGTGPDPDRETIITFDIDTVRTRSISDLSDICLHELLHASIGQAHGAKVCWGSDQWRGHHAEFRRQANIVAKQRGWPDCSENKKTGACAAQYWPPRTHH